MALISNIVFLTAEALTDKKNEKNSAFNNELSHDIEEVTALDLIPPPNGAGDFNDIGGYKFT